MNMEAILDNCIPLILYLQSIGEGFIGIMKLFTFLGNEEFYFILFPILFWCVDSHLGFRAGAILLLSGLINTYLKWILRLPRPYWVDNNVIPYTTESSFGAPSGHSQNAVAMWGLIASSISKPWFWGITIFLIFMIGLSRMALGVHFLLDVVSGWIIGALLLWGFLWLEPFVIKWIENKSHMMKVFISFLVSMGLIMISLLIMWSLSYWEIPVIWIQNAKIAAPDAKTIDPLSISGAISNAGVLFGVSFGYIIMNQLGGFIPQGKVHKQVMKYAIGIIGVLVIWLGLDYIFPEGNTLVAYIFRYIRYGLTGVWISLGAPWIFVKSKLANPAKK